jgi:DNA polymerase-3 subunit delta'
VPFRTIVGHRRLLMLLSRAVARDTLPPALLLAGPAGVGKRRAALAIAEALNCLKPQEGVVSGFPPAPTAPARHADARLAREGGSRTDAGTGELVRDACGECAACRRIQRGVHPDVIVIAPGDTGSIKIEQVRDVIDRAEYRPFEGRRRVVIIDEADALMQAAQNALLKTLEEPRPASIFVLVSSIPDALLPTVRSRCSRLRFGSLSPAEVAEVLRRDHGYSEQEARASAVDADGSVGRALQSESADLVEAREGAERLLDYTARAGDPGRRLDAARDVTAKKSTSAGEREQLAACLRALGSLLRDVGILAAGGDRNLIGNSDLEPQLASLARSFDGRRIARAYAAVDEALAALDRNASPKIVADWLVLQL